LLAKLNLKMVLAGAAVLGIVVIILLVNSVWKHHKNSNPLTNLPPARYEAGQSRQHPAAAEALKFTDVGRDSVEP